MVPRLQEFSGKNKYLIFKVLLHHKKEQNIYNHIYIYILLYNYFFHFFRLVRIEKNINLDQIQQLAMIPAKEAKCLTYVLAQENFIQMQEIKKAGTLAAPTKGPFHFYIDLIKIVQMEIEHCCQALYNIIKRRDHELSNNKRMIEKQLRVQILSSNMKEHGATEQQLADVISIYIYIIEIKRKL